MSVSTLTIPTARAYAPLLGAARYKGASGGRGSAKSWFFAGMLVEEAIESHIRAACLRESQNSIADSVKQLIEDVIIRYHVEHLFKVTEREITGPNDSLFVFRGLQNHTVSSIKSLEGFNRSVNEEAQTYSQRSMDIMIPTFRSNAELWFAWNPLSEKDPVERLFNDNDGDPDFVHVHTTYRDNPWFPEELRRDMLRDRERDPEKYAHVWLGKYRKQSEARVFRNWTVSKEPFDPPVGTRFYFGADWGFSVDPTTLIRAWVDGRTLYVDYALSKVGIEIDRTPDFFGEVPGASKWPCIADSARPETISYMQNHGYPRIRAAIKGAGSVEDGIEFLKSFDIIVHPRCVALIDELSSYSWKIDPKTDEVLPILEDKNNHLIDALRYAIEGARRAAPMKISDDFVRRAAMPVRRKFI
jgi:phage terminase large subunit